MNKHTSNFYIQGAYSISGLLKQALTVVPKNEWESTPVTLKATAGLRLLPQLVAEKILKQVCLRRDAVFWQKCFLVMYATLIVIIIIFSLAWVSVS